MLTILSIAKIFDFNFSYVKEIHQKSESIKKSSEESPSKFNSNHWWTRTSDELDFRVPNEETPKHRLIAFFLGSIVDEEQGLTKKLSHSEISKATKISDVNLKKMISRLTKENVIHCNKETDYKAGTGGWVRYRVHPRIRAIDSF